jgi:phosphatidylinositol alpha-mannosyltransferase
MRRVVLVSPYALSVFGGVQEQVLAMSRVLSGRGHDVLVVAPDGADDARYDTPAKVVRLGSRLSIPANGSRAPLTLSLVASRRARDVVSAFRPDVVHFHEPFAPVLGWATLFAHEFPSVATFHRSGDGPAMTYGAPVIRALARRLEVSVAVSAAAATTTEKVTGVASDVLFNGFETERFVARARERSVETVLFYVGRLENLMGVATLIEATREHNARSLGRDGDEAGTVYDRRKIPPPERTARSANPWRLVIAGDGPDRSRLEALAAHDPRVVFLGRISDAQKRSWLRRVHALVAPSTHGESFGLVLLEGMASETLVVASDINGYREAAGGHATLFHPGDARSLESAIETALRNDSVAATKAARDYAQDWSMSKLVDEYETRYELARQRFGHPVA